ncbi:CHAT domain-containing protein [Ilyonectria robusta]|uniref:CHAT domain-containing protein n=1 Tax=Ilyonectria robusta TaxID=1079257 RepID=UPI001E8E1259|nr:CHAT domain-containing protein [Ilyonectria robusta]KAH8663217.1 CHAT domain-containing protein [Ilyonectria robusta]
MATLDRVIEAAERDAAATPPGHSDRAVRLNDLGIYLIERFTLSSSKEDLDRAIEVTDMTINTLPQQHPDRARYLDNLATRLGLRFGLTGSIDDLNRAIDLADTAVEATPPGHIHRGRFLANLSIWLCRRFEGISVMDDLNRAIRAADLAVEAVSEDSPSRANYLSILGNCLGRRYEQTSSQDDLDHAISVAELSLKDTRQDGIHRVVYLHTLGMWLGRRADRTGSKVDLDRAIEATDMAVEAIPLGHPGRVMCLINLGMLLGRRFDMVGSMNDLNRAVQVTDAGLKLLLPNSPFQTACLNNLAMWLLRRFDRAGLMEDLDRAIKVAELAVEVTACDHPERIVCLNSLGSCLGARFDRTGSMDDLNRAVEVARMAIKATPHDHSLQASHWDALGVWLDRRFDRTSSMDDLNHAIEVAELAIEATPLDHMDRASYLNNLGCYLDKRFQRVGSTDDLTRSLSSFMEGWNCPGTPTSNRIRLALGAAGTYASHSNWEESSQLLEKAVELLPAFVGLASTAAAVALNAGKDAYDALKLLELGRGIIANLLMDMRGDISDLKQMHCGLADEFISLRDELDSTAGTQSPAVPSNSTSSLESQAKRRREADQKFTELIAKIRAQPGFESFFLPPTADELMAAANQGPIVVVNLSSYRSSFDMESLLEWLWDAICRPCLDALGFKDPPSDDNWPRVWWIPTGHLSRLPLHAAGSYAVASTHTVMDRVMSTYASSIKALMHGRRYGIRGHTNPEPDSALLIAMRETPNLSTSGLLPFAVDEVNMLAALCPSLRLKPIMPPPRKDEVLKHLQTCKIFHFAGHGQSDPADPSQSCLLLEDWKTNPLTAGALRDHRLQDNPPFFAYLSACSTGANEADRFADEGVHLAHAFQLAGFRHVIGTLWKVSDKHCVDVARVLYRTMEDEGMTDLAVCRGLHRAVRALRDGRIETEWQERNATLLRQASSLDEIRDVTICNEDAKLFYWVPYIHFGV